jgi:hypothetical protein
MTTVRRAARPTRERGGSQTTEQRNNTLRRLARREPRLSQVLNKKRTDCRVPGGGSVSSADSAESADCDEPWPYHEFRAFRLETCRDLGEVGTLKILNNQVTKSGE